MSDLAFVVETRTGRLNQVATAIRIVCTTGAIALYGWLGILMLQEGDNFQMRYPLLAVAYLGIAVSVTAQMWVAYSRNPSQRVGWKVVATVATLAVVWLMVISFFVIAIHTSQQ